MIYIVGLGPGSKDYMLLKATEILESSDLIIGFKRALKSIDFIAVPKLSAKDLKETLELLTENEHRKISIVASGDPCFYGILDYIRKNYNGQIEVIPGISSFQYLIAKLNKCWQGSFLGSLHGREEAFIEKVEENAVSIWLTDRVNSPEAICKKLYEEKLKVKVYVGENLSYSDEKISTGYPEELMNNRFSELSVVVIENDLHKG
ncbi:precorrin-6y C5,15-methyltransferase (decarboxylating) subunit CbiE [Candidatus Clostridium radicumherbarum]|uniref:Precorrin-6y C5,15-methyltransferase (Decarboxylating) subunit CbiE n=1 Tax=Candidatus Clostridium radicumherbarum TaxID=3381662 RepID=A0ABW8TVU1_9CLOT